MTFLLTTFLILIITTALYWSLACRWGITDKPGGVKRHSRDTVTGAGIIFPIAALSWFFYSGMEMPWFLTGLLLIAIVSFLDDLLNLSYRYRITAQLVAVALMMQQVELFQFSWYGWMGSLILITGTVNAFNFMDGINGMTPIYGLVTIIGLLGVNAFIPFADEGLIYITAMAALIIAILNARARAVAFVGDVGSHSLGFILCFLMVLLLLETANPAWVLLFGVYGTDTVMTILRRLYRRENIFYAHNLHLYELLAHQQQWPHLQVTALYALIQAAITALTASLMINEVVPAIAWLAVVLLILATTYWLGVRLIGRG